MTELEILYQTAYDSDISIWNTNFSPTKKAACLCLNGDNNLIVLDDEKITSESEEAEILTHELAHIESGNLFFITASVNGPLERANQRFYEAATTRETILKLLPKNKLQKAIYSEGADCWKIAEYCGRTIDFVKKAFEVYENMGVVFDVPDYAG